MTGPPPGITANFVVDKIDDDFLHVHFPRYCVLNPDQTLYFVKDQEYVGRMFPETRTSTSFDIQFLVHDLKDYGEPADVVSVVFLATRGQSLMFHEGYQYGGLFIANYPVPPLPSP